MTTGRINQVSTFTVHQQFHTLWINRELHESHQVQADHKWSVNHIQVERSFSLNWWKTTKYVTLNHINPIWNVWFFDTPYHWITLHPKCHLIRKPYLTNCHIFSFFQVIKLSALDFQRCESSVIMITQTCYNESCAKHLWKENVYSQQHGHLLAKMRLSAIHAQKGNHTQPSYAYALPTHEDALGYV
jgi:hypothetical protein